MAEAPFMPLYVGDYLRDTRHLTQAEHGAYMLLLMTCWSHGGKLPNDDRELSRISESRIDKWRNKMRPKMEPFFQISGGEWTHKRVDKELTKVRRNAATSRENGKLGGRPPSTRQSAFMGEKNGPVRDDNPLINNDPKNPVGCNHNQNHKQVSKRGANAHVFSGQIIKLNAKDYDQWRSRFSSIQDIDAELTAIDGWLVAHPEKQKSWFHSVPGMLNRTHQKNLGQHETRKLTGFYDDDGMAPV